MQPGHPISSPSVNGGHGLDPSRVTYRLYMPVEHGLQCIGARRRMGMHKYVLIPRTAYSIISALIGSQRLPASRLLPSLPTRTSCTSPTRPRASCTARTPLSSAGRGGGSSLTLRGPNMRPPAPRAPMAGTTTMIPASTTMPTNAC